MPFQIAAYHVKVFYYSGRHFEIFTNSADMPSKTVTVFHTLFSVLCDCMVCLTCYHKYSLLKEPHQRSILRQQEQIRILSDIIQIAMKQGIQFQFLLYLISNKTD